MFRFHMKYEYRSEKVKKDVEALLKSMNESVKDIVHPSHFIASV